MSVSSTAEYFKLLRRSGAIEASRLQVVEQRYKDLPDARTLSRKLVARNILTDWQARFLLSGRHRLRLGQYLLLSRLPEQVNGDRFLAVHERLDRKVDVLIFPRDADKNKELFERMIQQASAVAKLDHQNLFHLYDIDKEDGRYFLVFEHDDGLSLKNTGGRNLSPLDIANVVKQALVAIRYAHRHSVNHGMLDESQLRWDSSGHLTIRNIGLAKLLEGLSGTKSELNEYAVTTDPSDDVVAIGQVGKRLFMQHCGTPTRDNERQLFVLLDKISVLPETEEDLFEILDKSLGDWIAEQAVNARKNVRTVSSPGNQHLQSGADGTRHDGNSQTDGISGKGLAKSRPQKKTKSNPEHSKTKTGNHRLVALGVVVLAAMGLAAAYLPGLFGTGRGGSDDQAAVIDADSQSAGRSDGTPVTPGSGDSPKQVEKSNEIPGDDSNPVDRSDLVDASMVSAEPKESLKETTVVSDIDPDPATEALDSGARVESGVGQSSPMPSAGSSPSPETKPKTQETAKVLPAPKTIFVEGADGLPLLHWQKAETSLNVRAVVYGTVVNVRSSSSKKTKYLGFALGRRGTFEIAIPDRSLRLDEKALKQKFVGKHITVLGEIKEINGGPKIQIDFQDEVAIHAALPDEQTRIVGVAPSATVAVEQSGAFKGMSGSVQVPELLRSENDFQPVPLGPVNTNGGPLGLFLTVPESASPKSVSFLIDRDSSEKRWEISYVGKNRGEPKSGSVVAEINLRDDHLWFNWLKPDDGKVDLDVNYLQNCLLKLATVKETKTVLLRKPIACPQYLLDSKRPMIRERLPLKYMPKQESLAVQILPFPGDVFSDQQYTNPLVLDSSVPKGTILFDKDPLHQFFQVAYSVDFARAIKIEAMLQLNDGKGSLLSARKWKSFGEKLSARQQELNNLLATNLAYEPKRGEITKHKKFVKKLSEEVEIVNGQVAAFTAMQPSFQNLFSSPIGIRVFYRVVDAEFDLVIPFSDEPHEPLN